MLIEESGSSRTVCLRDQSYSEKFRLNIGEKAFTQQFAKFYEARLECMKPNLEETFRQRWGDDLPLRKICEVITGEECVIIGTIFKQMELQPSILKELGDDLNIPVQPITNNFTSKDDVLYLEDMLQRIALIGKIETDHLVTGVSIAVKGIEHQNNPGRFVVEEICYPKLEMIAEPSCANDVDVLFVSGLEFGGSKSNQMRAQLLVDYIGGSLRNEEEAKNISRVIIAGNSISPEVQDKEQHYKAKYLTRTVVAGTVDAMKELNSFLKLLTKTIPVTLMPGESDPSNCTLPQQPLHPCMLLDESGCLESSTNPYECDIAGVRLLGHSGQPCNNIKTYSKLTSSSDIMMKCLQWAHLAPTTPDTLASYPFTDRDPFIIKTCPHVFFAGNQDKLEVKYFEQDDHRCLCLALPKFSETGLCVKVNLRTLKYEPILLAADNEDE